MALHTPILMQPAGADADRTYTGAEYRAMLQAQYPFQGVIPVGTAFSGFKVAQRGAGANFSVDVPAGFSVIAGDDVASQGTYFCWSDSTFNLTTPGAPGSGTRLHRVVLQLRDKLNNGTWTTYDFVPVLVQDTGSGFPAEPASAMTLAQVSITAAQASVTTANIIDYRGPAKTLGAYKAGGTTRSATGVTADPDLSVQLGIGTYKVRAFLSASGATSVDLKFAMVGPSGANGSWGGTWHQAGQAWADTYSHTTFTAGDVDSVVTTSGVPAAAIVSGTIINATPGPLAVNWAVVNATNTIILNTGSSLEVERIA